MHRRLSPRRPSHPRGGDDERGAVRRAGKANVLRRAAKVREGRKDVKEGSEGQGRKEALRRVRKVREGLRDVEE